MNEDSVFTLGLLLAAYTEVLGMQAENMQRAAVGSSMAYTSETFVQMANEMRKVVSR